MTRLASCLFLAAQVLLALAQDSPYATNGGGTEESSGSNSATCYFPAGNIAYGNVPCNPDAEVSTCCGDASHCLANGLCAVGDTSDGLGGFLNSGVEFARGSCTDPSWQDPACFQHCLGCKSTLADTKRGYEHLER